MTDQPGAGQEAAAAGHDKKTPKRAWHAFLHQGDSLYDMFEEPAKIIKSGIQMVIGLWALVELGRQFYWSQWHRSCAPVGQHGFCYGIPQSFDVLNLTGDALAAAAAVELVYTLFTKGPDEALDPLMLGLSAAALLSLGSVSGFTIKDGVTLLLYALALGVLFLIKRYLAGKTLHESQNELQAKSRNKN